MAEKQVCEVWFVDPAEVSRDVGRATLPKLKWTPARRPAQPLFPMVSACATWWLSVRAALEAVGQLERPMLRLRAGIRARRQGEKAPR